MAKRDEKKFYSDIERRIDHCPICHCKQEEPTDQRTVLNRVPIWVFTIFLVSLGSVLSYMLKLNADAIRHNELVMIALNEHIDVSNQRVVDGTKILIELGMNQRKIMKKLRLEFEPIPDYQFDINKKK